MHCVRKKIVLPQFSAVISVFMIFVDKDAVLVELVDALGQMTLRLLLTLCCWISFGIEVLFTIAVEQVCQIQGAKVCKIFCVTTGIESSQCKLKIVYIFF